jgi:hypothetical protein
LVACTRPWRPLRIAFTSRSGRRDAGRASWRRPPWLARWPRRISPHPRACRALLARWRSGRSRGGPGAAPCRVDDRLPELDLARARDVRGRTALAGGLVATRHEPRQTVDLGRVAEASHVLDRTAVVGRPNDRDARDRGEDPNRGVAGRSSASSASAQAFSESSPCSRPMSAASSRAWVCDTASGRVNATWAASTIRSAMARFTTTPRREQKPGALGPQTPHPLRGDRLVDQDTTDLGAREQAANPGKTRSRVAWIWFLRAVRALTLRARRRRARPARGWRHRHPREGALAPDQQLSHRGEIDRIRLERTQQVLVAVGLDLGGVEQATSTPWASSRACSGRW